MIQGDSFGQEWSASLRRASDDELHAWLAFAHASADLADEIALRSFRSELTISTKIDGSFVTEADVRIEELLRTRIATRFPGHRITGEEFGRDEADDGVRWYIDPIDGTHNFMRGIPLFATLIAAECGDELQVGLISAPMLRQRWYAARGLGAWTMGGPRGQTPRRMMVSTVDSLHRASLQFRSLTDMATSRVSAGFDALRTQVEHEGGFGDFYGYALVADSSAEAMVEQGLGAWDLAAPWVIVEEAGGRITDFEGRRSLERGEGLATNGILHQSILGVLRSGGAA